jgi:hypothetical protein
MTTTVDICNAALSHLGNARRIVAIAPPDGTVEADLCATFYPMAVAELLESADWAFARKRTALSEYVTNDSVSWAYAYALPSLCVKPLRILTDNTAALDQDGEPFDVEGTVLYTNKEDAVLLYTQSITNPSLHTPTFVTSLGYLLASFLAGPIIKGDEGASASASMRKAAMALAGMAMSRDANRTAVNLYHTPSAILAREGQVGTSAPVSTGYTYGTGYVVN